MFSSVKIMKGFVLFGLFGGLFADPYLPQEFKMADPPKIGGVEFKEDLPYKRPWLATSLSILLPGLGHVYLGDYQTAGGLFATSSLGVGASQVKEIEADSIVTVQNIWMYGIYAAYRDARLFNGNRGYGYQMPVDSLKELSTAPFRPSILCKKEVWGGVLGYLSLAALIEYLAFPHSKSEVNERRDIALNPVVALPIGIGEEAGFRGWLQSALTESLDRWGGILASSAIFTAAHISNASELSKGDRWRYYAAGLPLIGAFGVYAGWLTDRFHSLQESTAVHTWIDFMLFLGEALSHSSIRGKDYNFNMGFSF